MSNCCVLCYREGGPALTVESSLATVNKEESVQNNFFKSFERYLDQSRYGRGSGRNAAFTKKNGTQGGSDSKDDAQFLYEQAFISGMTTCASCRYLMQSFCELYHQWKRTELLLDWKVKILKEALESGTKKPRIHFLTKKAKDLRLNTKYWNSGDEIISRLRNLNGIFMEKCSKNGQTSAPLVTLEKWKPPDNMPDSCTFLVVEEKGNEKDFDYLEDNPFATNDDSLLLLDTDDHLSGFLDCNFEEDSHAISSECEDVKVDSDMLPFTTSSTAKVPFNVVVTDNNAIKNVLRGPNSTAAIMDSNIVKFTRVEKNGRGRPRKKPLLSSISGGPSRMTAIGDITIAEFTTVDKRGRGRPKKMSISTCGLIPIPLIQVQEQHTNELETAEKRGSERLRKAPIKYEPSLPKQMTKNKKILALQVKKQKRTNEMSAQRTLNKLTSAKLQKNMTSPVKSGKVGKRKRGRSKAVKQKKSKRNGNSPVSNLQSEEVAVTTAGFMDPTLETTLPNQSNEDLVDEDEDNFISSDNDNNDDDYVPGADDIENPSDDEFNQTKFDRSEYFVGRREWSSFMTKTSFKCPECDFIRRNLHEILLHCKEVHLSDTNIQKEYITDNGRITIDMVGLPRAKDMKSIQNSLQEDASQYKVCATILVKDTSIPCPFPSCDVVLYKPEDMETHAKLHGSFSCAECDHCEEYAPKLSYHELIHTNDRYSKPTTFKCLRCSKRFKFETEYLQHHIQEHFSLQLVEYGCAICYKTYYQAAKRRLYIHYKSFHNIKDLGSETVKHCIFENCNAYYITQPNLHTHLTKKHNWTETEDYKTYKKGKFKCDICDTGFLGKRLLDHHRIKMHSGSILFLECGRDGCNKKYETEVELEKHVNFYHLQTKTKNCPQCNEEVQVGHLFKLHMDGHKAEEALSLYVCETCGKIFDNKSRLQAHVGRHIPMHEWRFSCDVCGRKFRTNQQVLTHKLSHTKEKMFVCTMCGNRYNYRHGLKMHESIVHGMGTVKTWNRPGRIYKRKPKTKQPDICPTDSKQEETEEFSFTLL